MTRTLRLIALLLLPAFASCQLLTLAPKQATYAYVGKVTTRQPQQEKTGEVTVPLSFTGGQWQMNSATCFHRAKTKVVGNEIHVTIITGLCSQYGTNPSPALHLKNLTLPEYDLIYIDPDGTRHPLGKLHLKGPTHS